MTRLRPERTLFRSMDSSFMFVLGLVTPNKGRVVSNACGIWVENGQRATSGAYPCINYRFQLQMRRFPCDSGYYKYE